MTKWWRFCDEYFAPLHDENIPGASVHETFNQRINIKFRTHPRKGDSDDFKAWFGEYRACLADIRGSGGTIIATDGSLRQGRGAGGFGVWKVGDVAAVETWRVAAASSFAAELQAIQGAFAFLVEGDVKGDVVFLVDNVTAMMQILDTTIHENQDSSIRAMKFLRIWLSHSDHNSITLVW